MKIRLSELITDAPPLKPTNRCLIGGSDARISETEPEDLIVRLGGHRGAEPGSAASFQSDPTVFVASGSRKRTPFPGRNSMPAPRRTLSIAARESWFPK